MLSDLEQVMNNPRLIFEDQDKTNDQIKKPQRKNWAVENLLLWKQHDLWVTQWSTSQASDRPELTAASPIRVLTVLTMRFTPKKVLPHSGATPRLWERGKAQRGSCSSGSHRIQFPFCGNFRLAHHTDNHYSAFYIHIKEKETQAQR